MNASGMKPKIPFLASKQLLVKLHLHKNKVDLGFLQPRVWRSL